MLWRLSWFLAVASAAPAAILPQSFGGYTRVSASPVTPDDAALWAEFGLNQAERASYNGAGQRFTLTAYRLKDPTGAFAAFQWQRPPEAQSSATSASIPGGSLVMQDNYLLRIEGDVPHPSSLPELYKQLPQVTRSALPPLYSYLPVRDRAANSERYLLGNTALKRFAPRIAPELAAFDRGAEAQLARYRTGGSDLQLVLISYPTPQMAMERLRQFANVPGTVVRRTGPMLALVPEGAGNPAAESLVNQITFNQNLTWNEQANAPTTQDAAKMILAISLLAAGLIVSSVLLGIVFGGSKLLAGRFGMAAAKEGFTSLHLDNK